VLALAPGPRRDLHLIAGLRAVSLMGDQIALVALMVRLAQHEGHSAGLGVGALAVANALPPVLLSPLGGAVVARVAAKRLLVPLALLEATLATGLGWWTNVPVTLALVATLGATVAFTMPGYAALVPAIVGDAHVAAAQGTLQSYQGIAFVAGPALGGLLVGATGQHWPLYFDALSFAVIALGTLGVHGDRVPVRGARERGFLTAGVRFLWHDRLLRPLTNVVVLTVLSLGVIDIAVIFLVLRAMHGTTLEYGLVWAMFGVGMILGGLSGRRLSQQPLALARSVFVGVGAMGAALAAMAVMPDVWWVLAPMLVVGLGNGVTNVSAMTLFTTRTDEALRGRMYAGVNAVFSGVGILSMGLGGVLLTYLAPRTVTLASGVLSLSTIAMLAPSALRAARRAELDSPGCAQGA
jgi:MFS family permease